MDPELGDRIAKSEAFDDWEVVVVLDRGVPVDTVEQFLWATWTRFNPATEIYAKETVVKNNHIGYTAPIVIDSRMKPWYPDEVEVREDIAKLVDGQWREYFR